MLESINWLVVVVSLQSTMKIISRDAWQVILNFELVDEGLFFANEYQVVGSFLMLRTWIYAILLPDVLIELLDGQFFKKKTRQMAMET